MSSRKSILWQREQHTWNPEAERRSKGAEDRVLVYCCGITDPSLDRGAETSPFSALSIFSWEIAENLGVM